MMTCNMFTIVNDKNILTVVGSNLMTIYTQAKHTNP
jgi:hypothetical protein